MFRFNIDGLLCFIANWLTIFLTTVQINPLLFFLGIFSGTKSTKILAQLPQDSLTRSAFSKIYVKPFWQVFQICMK